jgi:hypothetical protein
MWFNPSEIIKTEAPPVATFATSDTFKTDTVKSSRSSESSIPVSNGSLIPETLEVAEVAKVADPDNNTFVSCEKCQHFKSHNAHGKGAGLCLAGLQSSGSCWWSDSLHECIQFDPSIEWVYYGERKPDALLIECYTPNGDVIEVEARDEAHGEWLQRMNPRRECSDGLMPLKTFLASAVDKIETMFELNKTQT